MFDFFKSLFFGSKKKNEQIPNPPGRTFNKVLTGHYFGLENTETSASDIIKAKQDKIDTIDTLGLKPMFVRFAYDEAQNPLSAHVAFQKEVFAQKWNMVHVTEVSFAVLFADFDEFEEMAKVKFEDFKDMSVATFDGVDRRKQQRKSV